MTNDSEPARRWTPESLAAFLREHSERLSVDVVLIENGVHLYRDGRLALIIEIEER